MHECPNCGTQVDEGVRICPNCGFDTGESQAEEVRELREEGRIKPGRLNPQEPNDFAGGEPNDRREDEELPTEDAAGRDPREIDGGF